MAKTRVLREVVVAQLVEQLLPTPEIHGSNPDISKILSTNCTTEITKIKKKRLGMAHCGKNMRLEFHLVVARQLDVRHHLERR